MNNILDNPYQYAGTIVARLSTAVASAIWALVVLWRPDALKTWPLTVSFHTDTLEDIAAAIVLAVSAVAIARMLAKARPIFFGMWLYGLLAWVWVYSAVTLYVAIYTGITILRPGQLAAVTVMAGLSLYAFITNPKRRG